LVQTRKSLHGKHSPASGCAKGLQVSTGALVIPAKAAVHSGNLRKCAVCALDFLLRGNDVRLEGDAMLNETATRQDPNVTSDSLSTTIGEFLRAAQRFSVLGLALTGGSGIWNLEFELRLCRARL
jgi:hypothetical protein